MQIDSQFGIAHSPKYWYNAWSSSFVKAGGGGRGAAAAWVWASISSQITSSSWGSNKAVAGWTRGGRGSNVNVRAVLLLARAQHNI
jgi:hypothetical protein